MPAAKITKAEAIARLAECFRAHGYEGASLSLLTEASGLGKGSLYRHFPGGKEQMAVEVLAQIDAWFEAEIFAPLESARDRRAGIAAMIDATARYFEGGGRICLVGAFALDSARDRFGAAISSYFTRWIAALSAALGSGAEAQAQAEAAIADIQGALTLSRALNDKAIFARRMREIEARLLATLPWWALPDAAAASLIFPKREEASMSRIEFFYDVSSPWTYLAFENIQPLARELGQSITWRPFLVGGVFNAVNPTMYRQRENPVPLRDAWTKKDMQDWARLAGLKILFPPSVFPVNSVKALRALLWAQAALGDQVKLARAFFQLYWSEDKDISQDDVLAEAATRAGIEPERIMQAINDPAVKAELKTNTDEVMARGGFGSPTIFIDKTDMYFGNDRLPLIREALLKRA